MYIENVAKLRKKSKLYMGNNPKHLVLVNLDVLGTNQETIFFYHTESTVHEKEWLKISWLLPRGFKLQSEKQGCLIHIYNFICKSTGCLVLNEEKSWALTSKLADCSISPVTVAAVVIYPGSNGNAW
ncbi:hypothetical protein CROQUDRAFT_708946 [Cronartium quercuum f. sp. fusiforme G11]|uniref:Uncharacterized protein n=1 Tax=Cronartium quercuum f. sp. fusiforme G11 TaxID=708437 RepID=A0A9P6NI64_9BASI|nr:hypothetical protein CROQUDRAFT_708946 [Cronartium quercuum f. sp. fusiforme G11]